MADTGPRVNWAVLYEQALFETNPEALLGRVQLARAAIRARIAEVPPPSGDEQTRLQDGLRNLAIVEKEYPELAGADHVPPTPYVTLSSPEHVWLGVSEGVCELLGHPRCDLLGRRATEFVAPEFKEKTPVIFEALKRDKTLEGKIAVVSKNGSTIAFDFKARVFPDGSIIAYWYLPT
jgi:PAS domain S-box-containing protein